MNRFTIILIFALTSSLLGQPDAVTVKIEAEQQNPVLQRGVDSGLGLTVSISDPSIRVGSKQIHANSINVHDIRGLERLILVLYSLKEEEKEQTRSLITHKQGGRDNGLELKKLKIAPVYSEAERIRLVRAFIEKNDFSEEFRVSHARDLIEGDLKPGKYEVKAYYLHDNGATESNSLFFEVKDGTPALERMKESLKQLDQSLLKAKK